MHTHTHAYKFKQVCACMSMRVYVPKMRVAMCVKNNLRPELLHVFQHGDVGSYLLGY